MTDTAKIAETRPIPGDIRQTAIDAADAILHATEACTCLDCQQQTADIIARALLDERATLQSQLADKTRELDEARANLAMMADEFNAARDDWQNLRDAAESELARQKQAVADEPVATLDEWHEDYGFVTWWTLEDGQWLGEPAYIGSPLCDDWPGYHTHWTPHPAFPPLPAIRARSEEATDAR